MSKFKIYNGTDWVDPCDCNVHIRATDNSWKLLDPANCPTKYWTGTEWCPIECEEPCVCPEGYTYNAALDLCQQVTIIPATPDTTDTYDIVQGDDNPAYAIYGSRLYDDISSTAQYPYNGFKDIIAGSSPENYIVKATNGTGALLNVQQVSSASNDIFTSQNNDTLGRLNVASLWANDSNTPFGPWPNSTWITVKFCIELTETRQYVLGIGGDNQVKISINSLPAVNLWASSDPSGVPNSGEPEPFRFWHMFPITLSAGSNVIELSGWNNSGDAAFGAEIYDIPISTLTSLMANDTITPTDFENQYVVFSTKNLVSSPPLLIAAPGETINWSCPEGYTLTDCYGVPSCVINNTVPCGEGLSNNTEINIWFDNSGSMNSTLPGLEDMRDNLLQACLLPIYNNDVTLYNERVKVFNFTDYPAGTERFVRLLGVERNHLRTADTNVDLVINLTFEDESNPYGYGGFGPFDNTQRNGTLTCPADPSCDTYDTDVSNVTLTQGSVPYTIKGCAFAVNTGPGSFPGFQDLTEATFVDNGAYTSPNNLSSFFGSIYQYETNITAGGAGSYYLGRVVAALNNLGITIVC